MRATDRLVRTAGLAGESCNAWRNRASASRKWDESRNSKASKNSARAWSTSLIGTVAAGLPSLGSRIAAAFLALSLARRGAYADISVPFFLGIGGVSPGLNMETI